MKTAYLMLPVSPSDSEEIIWQLNSSGIDVLWDCRGLLSASGSPLAGITADFRYIRTVKDIGRSDFAICFANYLDAATIFTLGVLVRNTKVYCIGVEPPIPYPINAATHVVDTLGFVIESETL